MQAKRFFIKTAAFGLLNAAILAAVLLFFSGRNRDVRLDIDVTESNLLVMGENQHYGVAILGTSRGRVLSRDGNHRVLEAILGERVVNLSKGGGGGLMPAELHLSHFYSRGNTVDHILYLVDPWVFFSAINNENNDFFLRDEPFELSILWNLILEGYPQDRIFSYLQMIAVDDWAGISRYAGPGLTEGRLKTIDGAKLEEARQHYLDRYGEGNFERYSPVVDRINALAKKNGSRITYVMLPLLMRDFPGLPEVDRKLRAAAENGEHVAYVNLESAMQDRRFYYDHMHFNTAGIAWFAKNALRPILSGKAPHHMAGALAMPELPEKPGGAGALGVLP
ncbi:hypothetical protein [Desulfococcus sp.]|uniref:hypothetical protein n=1 Tax=Desulfococcus sp. TaxID=2025834 RepID=UPI0035932557